MITYNIEYTDTFAGEANYCWVRRATIELPEGASRAAILRAAKKAVGISGARGRYTRTGESIEWRPWGCCTVLFID